MQSTQPGAIFAEGIKKYINDNTASFSNEIATVSSVTPLRIKLISGLELDNRFLYIAGDLVQHKRKATFKIEQDKVTAKTTIGGSINSTATTDISGNITAITTVDKLSSGDEHTHTANTVVNNNLSASTNVNSTPNLNATTTITQTGGINQDTELTHGTLLNVGDLVIVCKISEGQKYVILNKIVKA